MNQKDLDALVATGLNPIVIDENTDLEAVLGPLFAPKAGIVDYQNAIAHLQEATYELLHHVAGNEYRSHKLLLDFDPAFRKLIEAYAMSMKFTRMAS